MNRRDLVPGMRVVVTTDSSVMNYAAGERGTVFHNPLNDEHSHHVKLDSPTRTSWVRTEWLRPLNLVEQVSEVPL